MRGVSRAVAVVVLSAAAPAIARAQCTVMGPDTLCAGQSVQLCGQSGPNEWTWTGPGGEALGVERCITVTAPGTYTLRQFDGDNGLFWTCEKTVVAGACDPPPPPPPSVACPRTAAWWWRQCRASGNSTPAIPPSAFASLAACADARSSAIDAKVGLAMCDVIERLGHRGNVRTRALRQFAAMQLNLCAREQGVPDQRGIGFGLDGSTAIVGLPGVPDGTLLASWVAATDAELTDLGSRSLRDRVVKRAYQRLRMQAFALNHGRGLGRACADSPTSREPDDEPELSFEDGGEVLVIESLTPNPARGAVRIAWSLPQAADVELSLVDIAGRTVRELVRGPQPAGSRELVWDGAAADGRPLRSGAYFVHGRVGGEVVQARLVLVR